MLTALRTLSEPALHRRLRDGLTLATGPLRYRVRSPCIAVARGLRTLYADFPLDDDGDAGAYSDFHVDVAPVAGPRRWLRPQVEFRLDGHAPFEPLAADHAFALLEWGMNWCIASRAHHFLLLHAAVLERQGHCVVLPGEPAAGKSTLAAALMLSGWRLLSDELALIDRDDGRLVPLARPVSLKNGSIAVIRQFAPHAVLGEPAHDTHKGTVTHLRPSAPSVARSHEKARATLVVFPRWVGGTAMRLDTVPKSEAFMRTAGHAFNYGLLGRLGFEVLGALVDGCGCWQLEYAQLPDALAALDRLSGFAAPAAAAAGRRIGTAGFERGARRAVAEQIAAPAVLRRASASDAARAARDTVR